MPGASGSISRGDKASAADAAVINTGGKRSRLPRITSAGLKGRFSCSAILIVWLIFKMPLRVAMPASVMKPIMLATDSG